jgi:deferrochelatase/peroxidase EfeB
VNRTALVVSTCTYQAVRLIRMATELWDAEPVDHQEDVFGRQKQTRAPLAGKREDQVPDFANWPFLRYCGGWMLGRVPDSFRRVGC